MAPTMRVDSVLQLTLVTAVLLLVLGLLLARFERISPRSILRQLHGGKPATKTESPGELAS